MNIIIDCISHFFDRSRSHTKEKTRKKRSFSPDQNRCLNIMLVGLNFLRPLSKDLSIRKNTIIIVRTEHLLFDIIL